MVLCLAMMLSIMVVGAGAAFADQSSIDSKHQDAVDMAVALNIINGIKQDDGSTLFKPTDNVTREQMAKMICILDNGGKEPQLASGNTFSDVAADRWSNKYIESCAARGVVAGVGGGKFNPGGDVTATQAAKMLLVELGYDEGIAKYTGSSWATNVNIDATKKGYYDELEDIDVSAPLSREHAAQMIWNALQADQVDYESVLDTSADGNLIATPKPFDRTDAKAQLLVEKYGTIDTDFTTGILTGIQYKTTKEEYVYTISTVSPDTGAIAKIADYTTAEDYTDLLGHNVSFVVKASDRSVYGAYAKDSNEVVSGLIGDISNIDKIDATTDKKLVVDDTDYKFESTKDFGVFVFMPGYNVFNAASAFPATASLKWAGPADPIPDYWEFTAIDNDDDEDINVIIVYPTFVDEAKYVDSDGVTNDAATPALLNAMAGVTELATEEDYQFVNDGVAKSDDITIVPDRTLTTYGTIAKLESVTGAMSGTSKSTATIDGTAYNYNVETPTSYTTIMDKAAISDYLNSDVEVLIVNGYIADITGETSVDVNDFVLVTGVSGSVNTKGYFTAELLLADGSSSEVTLAYKSGSPATPNAAKDDGTGKWVEDTSTQVEEGTVYTYKISSGRYQLMPVTGPDLADFDGYVFNQNTYSGLTSGTSWTRSDSTSDANAKVAITTPSTAAAKFAPEAVIFVKDGDDYLVKTGADLAKVTDPNAAVAFAGSDKDSKNAMTVSFAYIVTNNLSASEVQYAYVTSGVDTSKDSDGTYYSFTAWNGTEEVPLKTDGDEFASIGLIDEGAIISYVTDEDGAIIVADSSNPLTVLADKDGNAVYGDFGAIVAVDGKDFTFRDYTTKANTPYKYDKDDSTILFVNSKKVTGVEGTIDDLNVATEGAGTTFFVNAYVFGTAPDVTLIVVDNINSNWDATGYDTAI